MSIKTDKYGIIGQPNKDRYPAGIEGGDSLNWQGHWWYLSDQVRSSDIYDYVNHFENKRHPGLYVRHPNPQASDYGWASWCEGNWRGVESRDQMTGKLCYFAKAKATKPLLCCLWQHVKRGLLFANNTIHNGDNPSDYTGALLVHGDLSYTKKRPKKKYKLPDLTLFDIWALYIRGLRLWPLYPLFLIFDLQLVAGALIKNQSYDRDVISFTLKLITAQEIIRTPVSWFAMKILDKNRLLHNMHVYWCGWRDQCGMYDLYRDKLIEYMDRAK